MSALSGRKVASLAGRHRRLAELKNLVETTKAVLEAGMAGD
jgi:hypothetical protein